MGSSFECMRSGVREKCLTPPTLLERRCAITSWGLKEVRNHRSSNNVGGVKHFSRTLRHALEEERHFALVEGYPFPTKARSQFSIQVWKLSPTHASLRSQLDHDLSSNSSVEEEGTPSQLLGVLLAHHGVFGLSAADRIFLLARSPTLAHHQYAECQLRAIATFAIFARVDAR